MSDVKWIKIATDIFDDDKILLIESMPEADAIIVIWFKLLCMAGKKNNSGVFYLNDKIAYTDEMLATIFRRNINTVRLALSTFEQFGMIEIVNNTITIPNWEKHQQLDALEMSRDKTRKRVQKFRQKQKLLAGENDCNVTETSGNAYREEKRREDKSRVHSINDSNKNNVVVVNNIEREKNNNDDDEYNPFGDDGPEHPDTTTLEVYAVNNILNMTNARNMELLQSYRDDLSDDLIRFGIDMANKYCKNGVPTFGYLETILRGFIDRGIKTVEQAQVAEKARQTGKARSAPQQPQKESALFGKFY